MRKLIIPYYILLLGIIIISSSCADMHDPILHSGGMVRFVPNVVYSVDDIIILRMSTYYRDSWSEAEFYGNDSLLNDFHVSYNGNNYDFIDSIDVKSDYGTFGCVWYSNSSEYIDIYNNRSLGCDMLNDSVMRQPDFIFTRYDTITVRENIHDFGDDRDFTQVFREALIQRTFLYKVQVELLNNTKGKVIRGDTFQVGGLSSGFDMVEESVNDTSISHNFNTRFSNDFITGEFVTFGKASDSIILYIQLVYANTKRRVIPKDVTDQMDMQRRGGLILATIDIDEYPAPEAGGDEPTTDPFDVSVGDYENEEHYYN